jgi:hypothetical protein
VPYKGVGRVLLAARCSPPCAVIEASTLMASADGKERHECLAEDALDEAKAAAQTSQYQRWRRRLDVVWLPGGVGRTRADACVDRSLVLADPSLSHIWARNESVGPPLSVCVSPLGGDLPIFLSARTCTDAGWSFASAR